jgi:hypothetical protein
MTFLVSIVVTNYLPKSYPNLIRLYSTTFTSGDVELRSDYPQWRVVYLSEGITLDSYRTVHSWYEQNGPNGYTRTFGNNGFIIRRHDDLRIPMIGSVRIGESVEISGCSGREGTCVSTRRWFDIEFNRFFGEISARVWK